MQAAGILFNILRQQPQMRIPSKQHAPLLEKIDVEVAAETLLLLLIAIAADDDGLSHHFVEAVGF